MKKISIQVTLVDESFYDWFIEPRQATGELPSLVLRLLTAYANNDELAFQIDQYLDEQDNPEAYDTRQKILDALARLNTMDARVDQELEAMSDEEDAPNSDEDDDFDIDMSVSSGVDMNTGAKMTEPQAEDVTGFAQGTILDDKRFSFTPESVSQSLSKRLSPVEEEPSAPVETVSPVSVAPVGTTGTSVGVRGGSPEFESRVFEAIGALTTQISQLTQAVSSGLGITADVAVKPAVVENTAPVAGVKMNEAPVNVATVTVAPANVAPVTVAQPVVAENTAPVAVTQPVQRVEPPVDTEEKSVNVVKPIQMANTQPIQVTDLGTTAASPAPVEEPAVESEEDDSVPDFIFGFMNSLGG